MCATVWKNLLRSYCPANAHRELHDYACVKNGPSLQLHEVDMNLIFFSIFCNQNRLYFRTVVDLVAVLLIGHLFCIG